MQYAMWGGETLRAHGLVRTGAIFTGIWQPPPVVAADYGKLAGACRGGAPGNGTRQDGHAYTKAGIMLDDLVAAELRPRMLLEGDTAKRERLMTAIDAVNDRYGEFSAVPAAQGFKQDLASALR